MLLQPGSELSQKSGTNSVSPPNDSCGGGANDVGPKRLHVSNIPFRFRDNDLRQMFGVSHLLIFPVPRC